MNDVMKSPTDHTEKFDVQITSHALNTQKTLDTITRHCYKDKVPLFNSQKLSSK